PGEPVQLVIHQRQELVEGGLVSRSHFPEERVDGNRAGVSHDWPAVEGGGPDSSISPQTAVRIRDWATGLHLAGSGADRPARVRRTIGARLDGPLTREMSGTGCLSDHQAGLPRAR